jgi:hypothetical protein
MISKIIPLTVLIIICIFGTGFVSATNLTNSSHQTAVISSNVNANATSISPATGKIGQRVEFTLNGTELSKNIKVYLENGDTKDPKSIIANGVNVTSPLSLTGSFMIPESVNPGAWNVTIKEAGQISPSVIKFTITK